MSYLQFYEISVEPFSNAPMSRFYYNSTPHSKALVRLMYAIDSMKGLAVLIGEIGSGKTTLARRLLDSLPEDQYEAALLVIIHSGVDPIWLLRRIANQLGIDEPAEERLHLLGQIYQRLVDIHESGRKAVVLIDEAQMLASREIMEEFRGLLNLELPEKKLLNIILFGLPDLEENLMLDPPLSQRIAVKYRLDALDAQTTEDYIKHRLRLAGAKRMLFTKEATEAIYRHSHGIPRLINTIADNALFEGFVVKAQIIEAPLIHNVCRDLGLGSGDKDLRSAGYPRGGTRFTDYVVSPSSAYRQATPPSPSRAGGFSAGSFSNRNAQREHYSESGQPRSSEKSSAEDEWELPSTSGGGSPPVTPSPLIDEIDGILDNLIDKIK